MRFKIKSKCPYCGGTAVYTDETNEISCTQCGYTVAGADREAVISVWKDREPLEVRCSCGGEGYAVEKDGEYYLFCSSCGFGISGTSKRYQLKRWKLWQKERLKHERQQA